jgi:hypothetical protein
VTIDEKIGEAAVAGAVPARADMRETAASRPGVAVRGKIRPRFWRSDYRRRNSSFAAFVAASYRLRRSPGETASTGRPRWLACR